MEIITGYKFSLADIKIANVLETNLFRDTEHRRHSVYREYEHKKDNKLNRITLFEEIKKGEVYSGKYFLQDIAHAYKHQTKETKTLLLFLEEIEDYIQVYAISTYDLFNEDNCATFKMDKNEKGLVEKKSFSQFEALINYSDFVCDKIVVFADHKKRYSFVDDLIEDSSVRLNNIEYMSQGEIKAFFKKLKPIKKSNSVLKFCFLMIVLFCISLYAANITFSLKDRDYDYHDGEINSILSSISKKTGQINDLKKEKKQLMHEASTTMQIFIPAEKETHDNQK